MPEPRDGPRLDGALAAIGEMQEHAGRRLFAAHAIRRPVRHDRRVSIDEFGIVFEADVAAAAPMDAKSAPTGAWLCRAPDYEKSVEGFALKYLAE